MSSDRILKESIRRIQWGESGAYIVIGFNSNIRSMLPVGSRYDINTTLEVSLSGKQKIYLNISGVWIVFEIAIHSNEEYFTMVLFKGPPDLAEFGDGEVVSMYDIPKLYPNYSGFSMAEHNYYFTWKKSIRKYRTLVQMAKKIKRFTIPIFTLNGDLQLVNPNDYPVVTEQHTLIHANNVYPVKRDYKSISGIDYEFEASFGKSSELEGAYLEPGRIYKLETASNFGNIKAPNLEGLKYICRNVAIESAGDHYRALSVVSVYEENRMFDINDDPYTYATVNKKIN